MLNDIRTLEDQEFKRFTFDYYANHEGRFLPKLFPVILISMVLFPNFYNL